MANFTPTRRTGSSFKIIFSRFLFVIATIVIMLAGLVIAYPIAHIFVIFAVIFALIVYIGVVVFTLGIILLDQSFRDLFGKIASFASADNIVKYYPIMTTYCLYALIGTTLIYALIMLLLMKNRKEHPSFIVTDIIMLVISSISLVVLFIFKVVI